MAPHLVVGDGGRRPPPFPALLTPVQTRDSRTATLFSRGRRRRRRSPRNHDQTVPRLDSLLHRDARRRRFCVGGLRLGGGVLGPVLAQIHLELEGPHAAVVRSDIGSPYVLKSQVHGWIASRADASSDVSVVLFNCRLSDMLARASSSQRASYPSLKPGSFIRRFLSLLTGVAITRPPFAVIMARAEDRDEGGLLGGGLRAPRIWA
jgi:hypothetical protein